MKKFEQIVIVLFSLSLALFILSSCKDDGHSASLSDSSSVKNDIEALAVTDITFSGIDTPERVTSNIILPTIGSNGSNITWSTDMSGVIASDGHVIRPPYGSGDATVTLIATVAKGNESGTKKITIIVVQTPPTDREAVLEDTASLCADNFTFYEKDKPQNVTSNFTMPTEGSSGTTFSWKKKTDTGNHLSLSGYCFAKVNVSWPEISGFEPIDVVLTATVSKRLESISKDITITVYPSATTKIATTADGETFKMVLVPGGKAIPIGYNDDSTATISDAYWIGEKEVTYKLWTKVYEWAVNGTGGSVGEGQYSFANVGRKGNFGNVGTGHHPVTTVNWHDCLVWCNALTEWYNSYKGMSYECVYTYSDEIIRDSRDSNATECDNVVVNSNAKGFRLLSSNEWELAARYRGNDTSNIVTGVIEGIDFSSMPEKWTPGNSLSGATTYNNDSSNGFGEPGKTANDNVAHYYYYWDGDSWERTDVRGTYTVGHKKANALGLYDMSGNVSEFCFDLRGLKRVYRGGSFYNYAYVLSVGKTWSISPDKEDVFYGFRFAR